MVACVGQPAAYPWWLAPFTLLQVAENPSDRRAADAIRARIDCKCLLGLDLTDSGFDASVLNGFRCRHVTSEAEALLFDTLLTLCRERGLMVNRAASAQTRPKSAVRSTMQLDFCLSGANRHDIPMLAPTFDAIPPLRSGRCGRPRQQLGKLQADKAYDTSARRPECRDRAAHRPQRH